MSKLPVIIVFALLLTSCLELEQRIVVAADGSAVFTLPELGAWQFALLEIK